jgi:parallel beta-helix repeat protein
MWPNKWPEGRHEMKRHVTHRLLFLSSFLIFFLAVMHAGLTEAVTLQIRDDPTGGDCAFFAAWNAKTKTCTLTADLEDPVEISSNGVTLDGNGYAIRGTPPQGSYILGGGLTLNGVTGVTVTHMNVENFEVGIDLLGAASALVTHNKLLNNYAGIWLDFSSQNEIIANESSLCKYGIVLYFSGNNTIMGNIEEGNLYAGIYLYGSDYNNIVANELGLTEKTGIRINNSHSNTVAGNDIENVQIGLFMNPFSENNIVTNNNFVKNIVQVSEQPNVVGIGNTFAGNYWSDYDSPEEGCFDESGDGICDAPYEFPEGYADDDVSANVTFTVATATIEVSPNVIKTKTQENKTIVAYIEIPGFAPNEATVESIRLVTGNGYVWANETPSAVSDYDGDGVPELMVKFNKELVKMILGPGLNQGVVVGALAGNIFEGVVFITLE